MTRLRPGDAFELPKPDPAHLGPKIGRSTEDRECMKVDTFKKHVPRSHGPSSDRSFPAFVPASVHWGRFLDALGRTLAPRLGIVLRSHSPIFTRKYRPCYSRYHGILQRKRSGYVSHHCAWRRMYRNSAEAGLRCRRTRFHSALGIQSPSSSASLYGSRFWLPDVSVVSHVRTI